MGHSALSHCCRLRHMVLYYLGNTYTETHRGYATFLFSWMLMRSTLCANTHVEHQLYSLTFMCLTSYSPCREDRANAAISWMVRALLDFGNISMVSSTFTWKDKKKKVLLKGKTCTAAQLSLSIHPAMTQRKTKCYPFMEESLLRSHYFNNFSVLQGLRKWRFLSLHSKQWF